MGWPNLALDLPPWPQGQLLRPWADPNQHFAYGLDGPMGITGRPNQTYAYAFLELFNPTQKHYLFLTICYWPVSEQAKYHRTCKLVSSTNWVTQ